MRIRKRSGPLVLPSISTTLLSHTDPPPLLSTRKHEHEEEEGNKRILHPSFGDDQHLQPSDEVVHHQTSRTSSSDLELKFIRGKNGWVCCGDDDDEDDDQADRLVLVEDEKKKKDIHDYLCMMKTNVSTQKMEKAVKEKNKEFKGLKEEEEEEEEKMIREGFGFGRSTTKNRKESSKLGGEEEVINSGNSGVPLSSSNISSSHDHHQVVLLHERWCEGVKGFPLKKRRGSNCERRVVGDEEETRTTSKMEINIKQKKIMKTVNSSNKKWPVVHDQNDSQETEEEDHVVLHSSSNNTSSAKKNEGSRCSRINGRGWRCCQQTLVGYSLCEHHLGKGRLRSMNSTTVRSRSTVTIAKPIKNVETQFSLEKCEDEEQDYDDDDDEKSTSTAAMRIENKKRKKMGMVKARSIRSLLGQTQHDDDYVKV